MSSRRHIPPGMMTHGPFPGSGSSTGHRPAELLSHHDLLGNKVAVQAVEAERLAGDNEKLAASQLALRQELAATQHKIQRLKAHLRSIQTESDIQIRILLDKIAKMEADIRAGESVKKELQQAHNEAQSLAKARQELTDRIQKATMELQKSRDDVKIIPQMREKFDSLMEEHHRLRTTFEYEKGVNIEKVEQLQVLEKNMVGMVKELEKLRADVLNGEARASAPIPYGGQYMNQDPLYPPPIPSSGTYPNPSYPPPVRATGPYMHAHPPYPPPMQASGQYMNADALYPSPPPPPVPAHAHASGLYVDGYGRQIPYGGGTVVAPGSGPVWGGAYDPSLVPQR